MVCGFLSDVTQTQKDHEQTVEDSYKTEYSSQISQNVTAALPEAVVLRIPPEKSSGQVRQTLGLFPFLTSPTTRHDGKVRRTHDEFQFAPEAKLAYWSIGRTVDFDGMDRRHGSAFNAKF